MTKEQAMTFFSRIELEDLISLYVEYKIGDGENDAHILDYAAAENIEMLKEVVSTIEIAYLDKYFPGWCS